MILARHLSLVDRDALTRRLGRAVPVEGVLLTGLSPQQAAALGGTGDAAVIKSIGAAPADVQAALRGTTPVPIELARREWAFDGRPWILGIVNVTPDSFSDGGRASTTEAAVRHALSSGVEALMADRRNAELFLRHRRDVVSPLGRRWRELTDVAREDLTADLHARGVGKQVDDLVLLADSIIGLALTLTESILDGRVTNRVAAIDMMVRGVDAMMTPASQQSLGVSAA